MIELPEIVSIQYVKIAERRWATNVTYASGVTLPFSGKLAAETAKVNANKIYSAMAAVGWTTEEIQRAFPAPVSTAFASVQTYKISRGRR